MNGVFFVLLFRKYSKLPPKEQKNFHFLGWIKEITYFCRLKTETIPMKACFFHIKHDFESYWNTILMTCLAMLLSIPSLCLAQESRTYFKGKVPVHVEDRFDQSFDDLSAKWVDQFIDSLLVVGKSSDGEPYLCMAHVLQAFKAFMADDSIAFTRLSEQSLQESQRLNSNQLYYNMLSNQVSFYNNHHNVYKSQQLAEELLNRANRQNDSNALFNGHYSIGLILMENGDYKQAVKHFDSSLKYLSEIGVDDKVIIAQLEYNIGHCYYYMRKFEEAYDHLQTSIESSPTLVDSYVLQALTAFKKGDYATCRQLYAELENRSLDNIMSSSYLYYLKAVYSALTGSFGKALEFCQQIGEGVLQKYAISDVYSLQHDWDNAFLYYRLASEETDSIRQNNYNDFLISAENEMKASALLREKDEQLQKTNAYTIGIAFCFVILLAIFVGMVVVNRQRSEWQQRRLDIIKKYNDELTAAKEKAEEADRLKTVFLQNMSHDLRTPLNAIVGFSQLLGLPDGLNSEEEKARYNSYIANNSEMLMLLFEDILNVGEIEKGNFKIEPTPTLCNELCNKTLKCVEYRVPEGVSLRFTSNVDDTYRVKIDGRRVQQVLVNFLTNACKHTREGEICLDFHFNQEYNTISFTVTDTGEGVAKELRDQLFQRNVKIGGEDSHGFGLSICKTVADKMHGTVSLDRTYTQGSRFVFTLPLE